MDRAAEAIFNTRAERAANPAYQTNIARLHAAQAAAKQARASIAPVLAELAEAAKRHAQWCMDHPTKATAGKVHVNPDAAWDCECGAIDVPDYLRCCPECGGSIDDEDPYEAWGIDW